MRSKLNEGRKCLLVGSHSQNDLQQKTLTIQLQVPTTVQQCRGGRRVEEDSGGLCYWIGEAGPKLANSSVETGRNHNTQIQPAADLDAVFIGMHSLEIRKTLWRIHPQAKPIQAIHPQPSESSRPPPKKLGTLEQFFVENESLAKGSAKPNENSRTP